MHWASGVRISQDPYHPGRMMHVLNMQRPPQRHDKLLNALRPCTYLRRASNRIGVGGLVSTSTLL